MRCHNGKSSGRARLSSSIFNFMNHLWIFLKINPTCFFFLLLQWKIPYEIANISDHRTRNLSKDIFFFIALLLCSESFRETLITIFLNWKRKKKIIGVGRSIRGIKMEIKTRKFDFLLTCTKNNKVFWTFE